MNPVKFPDVCHVGGCARANRSGSVYSLESNGWQRFLAQSFRRVLSDTFQVGHQGPALCETLRKRRWANWHTCALTKSISVMTKHSVPRVGMTVCPDWEPSKGGGRRTRWKGWLQPDPSRMSEFTHLSEGWQRALRSTHAPGRQRGGFCRPWPLVLRGDKSSMHVTVSSIDTNSQRGNIEFQGGRWPAVCFPSYSRGSDVTYCLF